eukprot:1929970-Pyramimonas_sp.AAC.1
MGAAVRKAGGVQGHFRTLQRAAAGDQWERGVGAVGDHAARSPSVSRSRRIRVRATQLYVSTARAENPTFGFRILG